MKGRVAPIVGPIIGLLPITVLFLDGFWDIQLVGIIWAVYAVAGWLVFRRRNLWRARGNRWSALLIVVLLGGAQFGVHSNLPISADLTIALWYLVFGIGLAAAAIGVEMAAVNTSDASTDQDNAAAMAD